MDINEGIALGHKLVQFLTDKRDTALSALSGKIAEVQDQYHLTDVQAQDLSKLVIELARKYPPPHTGVGDIFGDALSLITSPLGDIGKDLTSVLGSVITPDILKTGLSIYTANKQLQLAQDNLQAQQQASSAAQTAAQQAQQQQVQRQLLSQQQALASQSGFSAIPSWVYYAGGAVIAGLAIFAVAKK